MAGYERRISSDKYEDRRRKSPVRPVVFRDGRLIILDQTRLPGEEIYTELKNAEEVRNAIKSLMVRGAPAIGVCAAYGLYVSCRAYGGTDADDFIGFSSEIAAYINGSRPTAVNLSRALGRTTDAVREAFSRGERDTARLKEIMLREADRIAAEDAAANLAMGEYGLTLLKPGMGILTHCNAGALATSMYGTCLSPVYLGQEKGYGFHVFCDETRPLLQGARLTAWELMRAGVDTTVICDNMASIVMKQGKIDAVAVGCDRMARNGDGANKIGTSGAAILAHEYGIPFYMFVPTSTIDLSSKSGEDIPIEERDGAEIGEMWYSGRMTPEGVKYYNPAFDVTDARYITAVITERGIVRPPYDVNIPKIMSEAGRVPDGEEVTEVDVP